MREKHQLTAVEFRQFARLRPIQGEAFAFWHRVAVARKLDPASVISDGAAFTALPENHDVHWCYPIQLKCKKRVTYTGPEFQELRKAVNCATI